MWSTICRYGISSLLRSELCEHAMVRFCNLCRSLTHMAEENRDPAELCSKLSEITLQERGLHCTVYINLLGVYLHVYHEH